MWRMSQTEERSALDRVFDEPNEAPDNTESLPLATGEDEPEEAQEAAEPVAEEAPEESTDQAQHEKSVPYERFQEVNSKYKATESSLAELQARLGALEAQRNTIEDDLFADEPVELTVDEQLAQRLDALEQYKSEQEQARIERLVQEQTSALETEIDDAVAKYPGIDKTTLYNVIGTDPSLSAMDVARHHFARDDAIRQKAIEDYKAEIAKATPVAPSRPSKRTRGDGSHTSNKGLSLSDTHRAAANKLFG